MTKPIVITAGDPAGIGYDIVAKCWQDGTLKDTVLVADPKVLSACALSIGVRLDHENAPEIIPLDFPEEVVAGEGNKANAAEIIRSLDIAVDGCCEGRFSAMVTAPLNKALINQAGFSFSGHTEYLAERTKAILPVMMLTNEDLRIVLVTTHIPLRKVADSISRDLIATIASTTNYSLKRLWNIDNPHIGVLGLNPHAGENGYIGREEIDMINPCLEHLREDGLNITGPIPACTAFVKEHVSQYDAIIAMYHDQGLPVIKALGFGDTVNVTLGLPIIRTSVDHGTAYDIARTGKASERSLISAINLARQLAQ